MQATTCNFHARSFSYHPPGSAMAASCASLTFTSSRPFSDISSQTWATGRLPCSSVGEGKFGSTTFRGSSDAGTSFEINSDSCATRRSSGRALGTKGEMYCQNNLLDPICQKHKRGREGGRRMRKGPKIKLSERCSRGRAPISAAGDWSAEGSTLFPRGEGLIASEGRWLLATY